MIEARFLRLARTGCTEASRATDGPGTGTKWRPGKSRGLTIKPGEGFCCG